MRIAVLQIRKYLVYCITCWNYILVKIFHSFENRSKSLIFALLSANWAILIIFGCKIPISIKIPIFRKFPFLSKFSRQIKVVNRYVACNSNIFTNFCNKKKNHNFVNSYFFHFSAKIWDIFPGFSNIKI